MGMREFVAVTWTEEVPAERWEAACGSLEPSTTKRVYAAEGIRICLTGTPSGDQRGGAERLVALLSRGARVADRDVDTADIARWLAVDGRAAELDAVVPPFAAVGWEPRCRAVRVATDYLGLRGVYVARGPGWAALSTSSRALAELSGTGTDLTSLAALSLIGWRIGTRTHFEGVSKLPPGAAATLRAGRLAVHRPVDPTRSSGHEDLETCVEDAAEVLRLQVRALIEDHPDTRIQLTGGLDSRILLAAVERQQRRHLEAMTLAAPGHPDAQIAADLTRRFGMRHHVVPIDVAEQVDPAAALELVTTGARRVELSSDPLAWASLAVVESQVVQTPRLSGLGGEVVRGFYYVGPVWPVRVSDWRIRLLAKWRLFPNESVADDVLSDDFAGWRSEVTLAELTDVFRALPDEWHEATDAFYLWQRMQRWAAATTTSTCFDRLVVNPMLDPRFIEIGRRVRPADRRGMKFLSSILGALDGALAAVPLDNRPAPTVYARPKPANRARLAGLGAQKAAGKVAQRVKASRRPAMGGVTLADRVVQGWRSDARSLDAVERSGVLRPGLLEQILDGRLDPAPSTVGLLVTLASGQLAPRASRPDITRRSDPVGR